MINFAARGGRTHVPPCKQLYDPPRHSITQPSVKQENMHPRRNLSIRPSTENKAYVKSRS